MILLRVSNEPILTNDLERIRKREYPKILFSLQPIVFFDRPPCKTFKLDPVMSGDENAINTLTSLLRDEQQGLSFIKDTVLPEYSFIAIEAIWWSIEHCEDIKNEQMALALFQV